MAGGVLDDASDCIKEAESDEVDCWCYIGLVLVLRFHM